MKNNKGFSVVELIVSFSLTMIIVVILFEIIVAMKEVYEKSVTETELINRQNLMTDYIYNDLINNVLAEISVCGDNCIKFGYSDGQEKQLIWDHVFGTIKYGDYTLNLINNAFLGDSTLTFLGNNLTGVKICHEEGNDWGNYNSYFTINIPINSTLLPDKDYGINILYVYEYGELSSINIPISSDC